MAGIVDVPVIDAATATRVIRYYDETSGGTAKLSQVFRILGPDGNPVTSGNPLPVTASTMDDRGLLENRPAANTVPAGQTYWAVDRINQSDEFTVSNGSDWLEL